MKKTVDKFTCILILYSSASFPFWKFKKCGNKCGDCLGTTCEEHGAREIDKSVVTSLSSKELSPPLRNSGISKGGNI